MSNQSTIVVARHGVTPHNQMISSREPTKLRAVLESAAAKGKNEADLIDLLRAFFKYDRQADEHLPLAKEGQTQCREAKDWLTKEGYTFKTCFSSPYFRAAASAKIIAGGHVARTTYEQLCERDLGVFHNLPRDLFYQFFPNEAKKKAQNPLDWQPPDGQTLRSRFSGLRSVAKDAAAKATAGKHVLIVAHADTNVGLRFLPELGNMIGLWSKRGPGLWNPLWVQNCQIDLYALGDPAGGPIAKLPTHFRSVAFTDASLDTHWMKIKR